MQPFTKTLKLTRAICLESSRTMQFPRNFWPKLRVAVPTSGNIAQVK